MNIRSKLIAFLVVAVLAFVVAACSRTPEPAVVETVGQIPQVGYTYVANAADGTVSAVDLATDTVVWTLAIGERAAHGIAASPDASVVYAGDAAAREVVVIDAARQGIITRIPLSTAVHGIDISPDGQSLWVGGSLDNDPVKGTLTVIDTTSLTVEDVISPGLGSASHFTFTPDGREIWIASTSTNLVWIVDTATRQVLTAVPLSLPETNQRPAPGDDWKEYLDERKIIGLNEVAISPDGTRAYAVGPTTSQLFAIDVAGRRVLNSVAAGQRAHGVSVSPDGQEVWIADWAGVVNVFDAQSLQQLAVIRVADPGGQAIQGANHVAFSPDGGRVYVSSINEVVVIDAAGKEVQRRLAVGREPHEFSLKAWAAPGVQPFGFAAEDGTRREQGMPDTSAGQAAGESIVSRPLDNPGNELASGEGDTAAAPGTPAQGGELTQINDERSVTVAVTPLNLAGTGATLDFEVTLDTHVVELDYDLVSLAVLRDSQGNEYQPVAWDGPRGGHHVSGILQFDGRADILGSGPGYLELELRDVAQVSSRLFRWQLD